MVSGKGGAACPSEVTANPPSAAYLLGYFSVVRLFWARVPCDAFFYPSAMFSSVMLPSLAGPTSCSLAFKRSR